MAKTRTIFNPPPNWPIKAGAIPPPGWQPDPAWGPAPPNWPLYVQKPSHVLRNVLLGILGVVVLCLGGCFTLTAVGVIGAANDNHKASVAGQKSCEGLTYPDHQKNNDHCANTKKQVTLSDVAVTTSALRRNGGGDICTTVDYDNNSGETASYNTLDWKLQAPSGQVESTFAGNLGSGDLVAGGHKKGTVCFDPVSGNGQFVLIYKPNPIEGQRGIWLYRV